MKFHLSQIIEVVDNIPVVLSTEIKVIEDAVDLYSIARDYLDPLGLTFVQRKQYCGYREGKHYKVVLIPQTDKLIVCSQIPSSSPSKLFPYLFETSFTEINSVHEFFQHFI